MAVAQIAAGQFHQNLVGYNPGPACLADTGDYTVFDQTGSSAPRDGAARLLIS